MRKGIIVIALILLAAGSFSAGVAIDFVWSGSHVTSSTEGDVPVWSTGESAWVPSGGDRNGLTFRLDGNTLCFPNHTDPYGCDVNVDWNGTDLVISG